MLRFQGMLSHRNLPFVIMQVEGFSEDLILLIDTGYEGSIVITDEQTARSFRVPFGVAVERFDLNGLDANAACGGFYFPRLFYDKTGASGKTLVGIADDSYYEKLQPELLRVGRHKVIQRDGVGLVGSDFLKKFKLHIDYPEPEHIEVLEGNWLR